LYLGFGKCTQCSLYDLVLLFYLCIPLVGGYAMLFCIFSFSFYECGVCVSDRAELHSHSVNIGQCRKYSRGKGERKKICLYLMAKNMAETCS
jgi:hypothetical protein